MYIYQIYLCYHKDVQIVSKHETMPLSELNKTGDNIEGMPVVDGPWVNNDGSFLYHWNSLGVM